MSRGWVVAAVAVVIGGDAAASGFAIREQSGSFQGLSFAGVAAGGPDISTLFFNPATLTLHEGESVHLSVSYIIPRAEFQFDDATDGGVPGAGLPPSDIGGGDGGDSGSEALVPAAYAAFSYGDARFGLGVTVPFGLRTEQPEDWAGRYLATESALETININAAFAYRFGPRLSVGAGVVAQYAEATLGNAQDLRGVLGLPGALPPPSPATDGIAEVDGSDWDYGFTLGVLTEPIDGTQIGVGYRSRINHSLEGDFTLTRNGDRLTETGGRAPFSTPPILNVGLRQRVTDRLDVLGTIEWTGWSVFEALRVDFDDPALDSEVSEQDWRNTWFVAAGAEYRPRPDLRFQVGAAFDQSPIRDRLRTPRIPGDDRTWLSLGAHWQPAPWFEFGGAYSRIFVADGDVDIDDGPTIEGGGGTLRGRFDNAVDIITVSGTLKF